MLAIDRNIVWGDGRGKEGDDDELGVVVESPPPILVRELGSRLDCRLHDGRFTDAEAGNNAAEKKEQIKNMEVYRPVTSPVSMT